MFCYEYGDKCLLKTLESLSSGSSAVDRGMGVLLANPGESLPCGSHSPGLFVTVGWP
jgi:hypothetical protein